MDHTSLIAFRVPEKDIALAEDKITDVASFQPSILGRFLHFDVTSPSGSPPGSPQASSSSQFASLERKLVADRDRFVEFLVREHSSKEEKMLQLVFALFDYYALLNDEDRRVRAEQIVDTFFSEGAVLLSDDRISSHARAAVRVLNRSSGSTKLSGRNMMRASPFAALFDKVLQRATNVMDQLYQDFERQRAGLFQMSTSPPIKSSSFSSVTSSASNSNNSSSASSSGMSLNVSGIGLLSSSTVSGGAFDLDLRLPTFEQMLKNNSTLQKVLVLSAALGYETHLRFLVLERDYRREVLDLERRQVFAQQIYSHFVSPSAPSPLRLSQRVRRALKLVIERKDQVLHHDLFAPAVSEVIEWLQTVFYPQLVANDAFMACCDEYFALEKLNRRLLSAVASGDDKLALQCLDVTKKKKKQKQKQKQKTKTKTRNKNKRKQI